MAAEAPVEEVPEGECDEVDTTHFDLYVFPQEVEEVLPPPCMDLDGFPLKSDFFEGFVALTSFRIKSYQEITFWMKRLKKLKERQTSGR